MQIIEVKTDSPIIEQKIREAFPDNYKVMLAIAQAESNLNPSALNPESHNWCDGSFGVFQIACLHVDDPEMLYDVDYNIEIAKKIYNRDGIEIWGSFTDLRYLAYLQ